MEQVNQFEIVQAELNHLDQLVLLFDAYRCFYKLKSDQDGARLFLRERISKKESIIFCALCKQKNLGFTQLYPTFSSLSMKPTWVLNDLFVAPEVRGQGIAKALLARNKQFVSQQKGKGVALETAEGNPARHLYEKLGWKEEKEFVHYYWNAENNLKQE